MLPLLVALAALVALGSAGLSLVHLRRVGRVASADDAALATALKRVAPESRIAELSRRATGEWEARLARELLATEDASARVALVNDALADVARALEAGAGWPSAAIRIDALGAVLLVAVAVLTHRLDAVLPIVGVAGAGLVVVVEASRRAKRLASAQRAAVDALIEVVAAPFAGDAPPPPRRRGHRRGASRT